MTFLYLVPTGMNNPEEPGWGSWAGRYGKQPDAGGRDYYWANEKDSFNGTTSRENTLARWAIAIQNDFAVRADWCVADEYRKANHHLIAILNGNRTKSILRRSSRSGDRGLRSAAGSSDPDGDAIRYSWLVHPKAGTFRGECKLHAVNTEEASFLAPTVDRPETILVLLELRDDGQTNLFAYRRFVLTVMP